MVGLDCSGFVQECLAAVGLDPAGDQTAQGLHDYFCKSSRGDMARKLQPGAIAFFGAGPRSITHVALCLDDAHMIEAGGGGSKTTTKEDAIKQGAFVRIRPLARRKDLVAIYMPPY